MEDWQSKLWCRFFCLSVYVTMYLNDHQRTAFYESLGLNTKQFNRWVCQSGCFMGRSLCENTSVGTCGLCASAHVLHRKFFVLAGRYSLSQMWLFPLLCLALLPPVRGLFLLFFARRACSFYLSLMSVFPPFVCLSLCRCSLTMGTCVHGCLSPLGMSQSRLSYCVLFNGCWGRAWLALYRSMLGG